VIGEEVFEAPTGAPVNRGTRELIIGRHSNDLNAWRGRIDEVTIWNRRLK
jgi:hypothetical protein